MKTSRSFRAVLFDMDGVLVDSERYIAEAAIEMFRQGYDTEVDPKTFLPFVGTGEGNFITGVGKLYNISLTMPRDKEKTYEIYEELIQGHLHEINGARAFVQACKKAGLAVAIATSADKRKMMANLRELGFHQEDFDATVHGAEVKNNKPDPEIYLRAAQKVGIDPGDCLVVEDAVRGIEAGKAAGARCLGLTSSFDAKALLAAGADYVAADLAEALKTPPPNLFQSEGGAPTVTRT
ncbi:HAD family hydrolase [Sediminispirochaeta bajacaliforniensis]|uniref:HAD family hydrolase n=1 Tax=Sediminispirochaeta bajacaliforniensis TaxID=148 RepID=UPI00037D2B73|nr:HAD family phosphatase [Sediminispirochaeta bajacaliforniensis]